MRRVIDIERKSFNSEDMGISILAEQDLLWPCLAYEVLIGIVGGSGLDLFEETVLRLTEVQGADTERLAGTCLLNQDLVAFIQSRLQQKDYLDSCGEITEKGKSLCSRSERKNMEYKPGRIFVDAFSGCVLPYVTFDALRYESVNQEELTWMSFYRGSDSKKCTWARIVTPISGESARRRPDTPRSEDVIRAIKLYARLSRDGQYSGMRALGNIKINEKPQEILLHCRMFLQKGNVDSVLVSNGFGYGFSRTFMAYINRHRLSTEFKGKNSIQDAHSLEGVFQTKKSNPTAAVLWKQARENLDTAIKSREDTSSTARHMQSSLKDAVSYLHAAFEHALKRQLSLHPTGNEWLAKISGTESSPAENATLLWETALNLGFLLPDKPKENALLLTTPPDSHTDARCNDLCRESLLCQKILSIRPDDARGRIREDMRTLLCLNIAAAAGDSAHPLRRIAMEHPRTIYQLAILLSMRNEVMHAASEARNINYVDALFRELTPVLELLYPSLSDIGGKDGKNPAMKNTDWDNDMLVARFTAEREIDINILHIIGRNLTEAIYRVELTYMDVERGGLDSRPAVLASALQTCINSALLDLSYRSHPWGETSNAILSGLIQRGFLQEAHAALCPKDTFVKTAIKTGQAKTLGSAVLALAGLLSEQDFAILKRNFPEFFQFCGDIIKARGHNGFNYMLDKDTARQWKRQLYKAIQILMEIKS